MNVIFLDFDGVLNNKECWVHDSAQIAKPCITNFLQATKEIFNSMPIRIVISSSWRDPDGIDTFKRFTYDVCGNCRPEIDILFGYLHPDYCTKKLRKRRGDEVREYLSRHPEITKYICVDDESDYLKDQPLLHTYSEYGLTPVERDILISYFLPNRSDQLRFLKRDLDLKSKLIQKIIHDNESDSKI